MKFLISISLFSAIVYLNSCTSPVQASFLQDSLLNVRNNHSLAGKLYFFAPEFDSTNLVATGACDCCSANAVFLDDTCFVYVGYCDDGSTYSKGKYQLSEEGLVLNFDNITVEKSYPETDEMDSTGQLSTEFTYNTIIDSPSTLVFRKKDFRGRIFFRSDYAFGAVDTGGTAIEMMKSIRGQGIWDRLAGKEK